MALDITNPQTITSSEGTGFAKVIPLEKFQAADTKNLIDHQWDKFQLEKQKQEKLKSNLASLPKAVVAKEEKNRKEIADDYNSFLDFSVNLAAQGVDLTSNPEFMKREQQLKQKVALDGIMAKKLGEYKSKLEENGTKYDQDLFDQRLKEYNEAATMEDRVAAMNKPWLLENIEPLDGLKEFFPEVQGYGAITNEQANKAAKLYYMNREPVMREAIERGIYKDEEDALAKTAEAIKLMSPYKNAPKRGGRLNISVGGGAYQNDRYAMRAVHNPKLPYSKQGEANQVVFSDVKAGKSINPQTLDINGEPVFAQPLDVVKKNGNYFLRVQRAKRVNVDEFARMSDMEKAMYEEVYDSDTNETSYVQIKGTKIEELPFKKDDPNWSVITDTVGYDPIQLIEGKNAGNKGGETDQYVYDRLQQLYKENRELSEKALSREKAEDKKFTDAERAKHKQNSAEIEELRAKLKNTEGISDKDMQQVKRKPRSAQ